MDALKKAELAKRQGRSDGILDVAQSSEPSLGGLTLEPRLQPLEESIAEIPAPAPPAQLPNLPSHLEELDAQFLASHTPASPKKATPAPVPETTSLHEPAAPPPPRPMQAEPRPTAPPEPRQEPAPAQAAAQNLFAAKQTEKAAPRKSFAIAIGVLTVLAVLGIGGYFWWQLQPKSGLAMLRPPQAPPSAPSPPVPTAVATAPVPAVTVPAPSTAVAADEEDDENEKPTASKSDRTPPPRPQPVAALDPDSPVRVSRTPLRVNPQLMRAYDAFGRGDLAASRADYEKVLKSEPRNTDAMHGLAAIALRQGRYDQAEWFYQRILEADPQDNIALSALINTKGPVDTMAAESRLKTLAASQPELSAPHFALGNLFARQSRWEEAQQAYFRAYSAEPDNPDILYNLAVSLEHLRQTKLAIQYYGLALAAAQTKSAGFDRAQAATHLRSLQP